MQCSGSQTSFHNDPFKQRQTSLTSLPQIHQQDHPDPAGHLEVGPGHGEAEGEQPRVWQPDGEEQVQEETARADTESERCHHKQ